MEVINATAEKSKAQLPTNPGIKQSRLLSGLIVANMAQTVANGGYQELEKLCVYLSGKKVGNSKQLYPVINASSCNRCKAARVVGKSS